MFKLHAIRQKHENILTFNLLSADFFDVEETPAC